MKMIKHVQLLLLFTLASDALSQELRFGISPVDLKDFNQINNRVQDNIYSLGTHGLKFNAAADMQDFQAILEKRQAECLGIKKDSTQKLDTLCEEVKSKVRAQKDACNCITGGVLPEHLNGNDPLASESYALARISSLMDDFRRRSEYSHNMLILHAQAMDENLSVQYGLNENVKVDEKFVGSVKNNIKESVKEGLKEKFRGGSDFDEKVDEVISGAGVGLTTQNIANVLKGIKVPGESCIPMKDYLFLNSFPMNTEFWKSFDSDFSPNDWDIRILTDKFAKSKDEDEKFLLSSRIEFLEMNPHIKLVLNSKNKEAASKIYDVMKKYLSGYSCPGNPEACFKQFSKKSDSYRKELGAIFKQPEMIELIQKRREEDVKEQISSLVTHSLKNNDLGALEIWSRDTYGVSMNDCELAYFSDKINNGSSTSKNKKKICVEQLPLYCQSVSGLLNKAQASEEFLGSKSEVNDLFEGISGELNPDPMANFNYKNDSDFYCSNHYRIHNGKSVTFDAFQKNSCEKKSPEVFCSDRSALFRAFMAGKEDEKKNSKNYHSGISSDIVADFFKNTPAVNDIPKEVQAAFEFKDGIGAVSSFVKPEQKSSFFRDLFKKDEKIVEPRNAAQAGSETHTQTQTASDNVFKPAAVNSQPQVNNSFSNIANDAREAKQSIDEEIRATKEAIAYNQERLNRPNTTSEFKSEVENRIQSLEMLLSEKEKSSQQYQELIAKMMDSQNKASTELASTNAESSSINSSDESQRVASQSSLRANTPNLKNNDYNNDSSRAPASVEAFSTSGGSVGGAASVGGNSLLDSSAASRANRGSVSSALLAKYGITVQNTDDKVVVAQDKELKEVTQLLISANKSDIGVEVSKTEYEKFKNNDISALNKLYEEKLESLDTNVVKLMIHAPGVKDSLEFYAIKEDGKVFFQPIRKNTLIDLKNALSHQ